MFLQKKTGAHIDSNEFFFVVTLSMVCIVSVSIYFSFTKQSLSPALTFKFNSCIFFFHSFSVRNVTIFTIFFYSNHVCWSLVAYLFLCNIFNSYSFCSIRTCVCCRLDDSAISQVIERIVQSKCMKKKKNKNKKDKQIWLVEWATSNLLLTKWIFYVLNYAKIQSIHCQFRIQWK